jgi:hypothetical protein
MYERFVGPFALLACTLTVGGLPATTPSAAPAGWRDSTVVVLVPADVDTAAGRLARLREALKGTEVVALYSASDPATLGVAQRLQEVLGGSLRPYDRGVTRAPEFARRLAKNAIGSNAGRTVVVVVQPDFVAPFLRHAMAMVGRPPSEAGVSMRPGEALVVSFAEDHSHISRISEGRDGDAAIRHFATRQ